MSDIEIPSLNLQEPRSSVPELHRPGAPFVRLSKWDAAIANVEIMTIERTAPLYARNELSSEGIGTLYAGIGW